jgi:sigma-54 dependent transcriptional regulator, acetoin dehydrogenase operon transcriptional activator AcoR
MQWRDQVALVTGAARGIGRATARLLAQRGAALCVNYAAHADAAEALIAEIAAAGGRPIPVDFAVICATHQNLRDLVATGAFRSDLYFRIGQYTIDLPSVRALPDKRAVIRTLWAQLSTAEARIVLAPETIDLLAAYEWPGNFRQLVGTLRALLVLAEPDRPLAPDGLPAEIRRGSVPVATPAAPQQPRTENCRLDHMTKEMMRVALALAGGNVSDAARRLGINRSTLYRRLLSETGRR